MVSAHDVTDEGGINPGPSIILPPIPVGPGSENPGDPSNGGASPPGGNGGGSTPGVGGGGQGPTQVGTGGDSSLQFSASPVSDSDYENTFTSNPKQIEFGDLNFDAVILSRNSYGRNADGSIYTDGIIDFKTAKGTFQASPSTPGTYITAKPVTNPDGTAGMEITVNRGA